MERKLVVKSKFEKKVLSLKKTITKFLQKTFNIINLNSSNTS